MTCDAVGNMTNQSDAGNGNPSKHFGIEAVWFMTDQVDSVHLTLDDRGKTLSRVEYMPYGETFVQKGDKEQLDSARRIKTNPLSGIRTLPNWRARTARPQAN